MQVIPGSLSWEMNRWGITSFLEPASRRRGSQPGGHTYANFCRWHCWSQAILASCSCSFNSGGTPECSLFRFHCRHALLSCPRGICLHLCAGFSVLYKLYSVRLLSTGDVAEAAASHMLCHLWTWLLRPSLQLVATSRTTFWNHGELSQPWWIILWLGGWCWSPQAGYRKAKEVGRRDCIHL